MHLGKKGKLSVFLLTRWCRWLESTRLVRQRSPLSVQEQCLKMESRHWGAPRIGKRRNQFVHFSLSTDYIKKDIFSFLFKIKFEIWEEKHVVITVSAQLAVARKELICHPNTVKSILERISEDSCVHFPFSCLSNSVLFLKSTRIGGKTITRTKNLLYI